MESPLESAPESAQRSGLELAGRTAVVTGAGTGIGRAIARELARAGARVVAVGRRAEPLAETCAAITAAGGAASPLAADLREAGWLAELDALAPEVDVVVNNAAAFAPYGPLEDVPFAEVERVIAVDLLAPMRLVAHVLGGMKARGFGRVVNVGSIAATTGAARQTAYATAKSGLEGFTKSVALEGAAHGVTANLVHPGLVRTERTESAIAPQVLRALVAGTPVGRAGTAAEIAALVGFLCSRAAGFVTGACIPVSGGLELGLFPPDTLRERP